MLAACCCAASCCVTLCPPLALLHPCVLLFAMVQQYDEDDNEDGVSEADAGSVRSDSSVDTADFGASPMAAAGSTSGLPRINTSATASGGIALGSSSRRSAALPSRKGAPAPPRSSSRHARTPLGSGTPARAPARAPTPPASARSRAASAAFLNDLSPSGRTESSEFAYPDQGGADSGAATPAFGSPTSMASWGRSPMPRAALGAGGGPTGGIATGVGAGGGGGGSGEGGGAGGGPLADEEQAADAAAALSHGQFGDWTLYQDTATGRMYYYNAKTDESQWAEEEEGEQGGVIDDDDDTR